ncbi:MAG: hypothetical protein DRP54_05205 [Spirochaetes bacterium]|nr:MAG: hypothetical protein DRP54_05205 [Spirochaetota bacterium]
MKFIKRNGWFVVSLVLTGIIFFIIGMGSHPERGGAEQATPVQQIVIKDEGGFADAISRVANALMPAVVHIDVTGTVVQSVPTFPFGEDPFFRYFFGPMPKQREVPIRALGSGVIISKDGYIITNNHVVENAKEITVMLFDKTKHEAKLIGRDPRTDLAVIKIKPSSSMKYASFGDSDKLKVGEWVIAIGSPRGFDWTVTAGIVSAKNRTNIGALGPTGYEDFIQTDAAINPGNSGGPLINLKGEVIGINSLIVSTSQGYEGLSFAIPSNMAKNISEALIKEGRVVRGWLGVSIQDLTPEMAKPLGLPSDFKAVIVAEVFEGSPAEKAGIEQGDIITYFNGKRVESAAELRNLVAQTRPGTTVTIKLIRNKREIDIRVKIGELEKAQKIAKGESRSGSELLGVRVEKVSSELAKKLGLRRATGVVIKDVYPGSPAQKAGLEPGDIIFRVGNVPVNSPDELSKLIQQASREGEVLLLVRDGRSGRVGYILVPLK